jgi:glycosyltransferase involved in cell wall biosynthesis
LRAADLFLLPSKGENFCVALVEAVACGTFSLVSPHVGAAEFLPADRYAVVPLDATAWARRCEELVHLPRGPHAGAYADLAARFSADAIAAAWLEVYGEIGRSAPAQRARLA